MNKFLLQFHIHKSVECFKCGAKTICFNVTSAATLGFNVTNGSKYNAEAILHFAFIVNGSDGFQKLENHQNHEPIIIITIYCNQDFISKVLNYVCCFWICNVSRPFLDCPHRRVVLYLGVWPRWKLVSYSFVIVLINSRLGYV